MQPALFVIIGITFLSGILAALTRHACSPHRAEGPHSGSQRGEPPRAETATPLSIPRWVYHWRGKLIAPLLGFALFSTWHETEAQWLTLLPGAALVALGVTLRVWAQSHIRFRLRLRRHLTTTGPYTMVRNPLYIANALIVLGAVFMSELLWLVPIALLWCAVVYSLVVCQEEARLTRQYGADYLAYATKVPRWLPHPVALRSLAGAVEHLRAAALVELPCLLIMLPYVAKELLVS